MYTLHLNWSLAMLWPGGLRREERGQPAVAGWRGPSGLVTQPQGRPIWRGPPPTQQSPDAIHHDVSFPDFSNPNLDRSERERTRQIEQAAWRSDTLMADAVKVWRWRPGALPLSGLDAGSEPEVFAVPVLIRYFIRLQFAPPYHCSPSFFEKKDFRSIQTFCLWFSEKKDFR